MAKNQDVLGSAPVQKVVVVNGNTELLDMLETVLEAGNYDMVFVESNERAYTKIKKTMPHLVILCTRIDQLENYHLLTMLKLDPETRDIPVLTYATECEGESSDEIVQLTEEEDDMYFPRPGLRMN